MKRGRLQIWTPWSGFSDEIAYEPLSTPLDNHIIQH